MRAKTRIFGEIDIPQDKIITMEKGMIGFSELKNYTLIYNSEKENDKKSIMWLQSMDDGDIAFPVTGYHHAGLQADGQRGASCASWRSE